MLRLSTRARYALRAMLELATHDEGRMLLRDIAEQQELPAKYLEQLAIPLRHAGLIEAQRGSSGGYVLARPPEEITVLQIVEAVEGPLDVVKCVVRSTVCTRAGTCAARSVWVRLCRHVRSFLAEVSLAEVRDEQLGLDAGLTSPEPCAVIDLLRGMPGA
jgi:Rrf2 family transcriptional regulator, cysteine metabolism repressor